MRFKISLSTVAAWTLLLSFLKLINVLFLSWIMIISPVSILFIIGVIKLLLVIHEIKRDLNTTYCKALKFVLNEEKMYGQY